MGKCRINSISNKHENTSAPSSRNAEGLVCHEERDTSILLMLLSKEYEVYGI